MRITLSYTVLFLLCLTLLSACKKIDESKVPSPGSRELLTSKTWLIYGLTDSNGNMQTVEDDDCSNDKKWKFTNAGVFTQFSGCDEEEDGNPDNWSLNDKTISFQNSNVELIIVSISPTSMSLSVDGKTYYLKSN